MAFRAISDDKRGGVCRKSVMLGVLGLIVVVVLNRDASTVRSPVADTSTAPKPDIRGSLKNAPNSAANIMPYKFKSLAKACPAKSIDVLKTENHFEGQGEVDFQLHRYLFNGSICDGTYIEMGAMDGKTFSNTWYLNKAFGFKGVLIEGSPELAKDIPNNRPNELATVNAGVCNEPGTLHYVMNKGSTNGFYEFAAEGFIKGFWSDLDLEKDSIPVKCQRMTDLLEENAPGVQHYDLFSLDVEGGELEVLQSIDFSKVGFGLIVVEADGRAEEKDQAVRDLLQANGYILRAEVPGDFALTFENNDFFFHKDFDNIYKEVQNPGSVV